MALRPYGGGVSNAGDNTGGGGGLSILYAGSMAESTLSGAHVMGATTLTLASAAGFRADMTLGLGVEAHDIVSVDEAANQVEIAPPGIVAAAYVDGAAVFAVPMFGADDALAIPAPAGASQYTELDVRCLYDMPQANGNPSFYNGRSAGAYYSPHASWFETLTNQSYWFAGGNTEPGLASYSLGVIHATSSLANLWALDYEPAGNRLILLPANPALVVSYIPRIYQITVVGRA